MTPDQKPGQIIPVTSETKLRAIYVFPQLSSEEHRSLGIPEPKGTDFASKSFLEWFDAHIADVTGQEMLKQFVRDHLTIYPYINSDLATLTMSSDDFMRMSWTYPAIQVTGNFQILTADADSGNQSQLEVPTLKGIEAWAKRRHAYSSGKVLGMINPELQGATDDEKEHNRYLRQRLLGIELVDTLEDMMIERYRELLLPVVVKSFEAEGFQIDHTKASSTRFHSLEQYISFNSAEDNENLTCNRASLVKNPTASFVRLRMEFQLG